MKRRIDPALIVLALALVAGAYFRFWDLTSQSLFLDEGYTFMVAAKPWQQMIDAIVFHDFHPPLFYALTHDAIGWLHWQVWDYRYLTAPFGMITIVASWAIARRLFGDVAASIVAVLVAVEPSLIQWDRLYRMYSVMTAIAALSWWLLLVAQASGGARRTWAWIAYGATAIVAPYIHYLGAVNVLCQGLYALTDARKRWPVFAFGAASVLALIPWAWAIRIQYPNGGHVAGTADLPIYWQSLARDTMLSGLPQAWAGSAFMDWAIAIVVVGASAIAIWRWPKSILPYWLAVGAVQVLATVATGKALVIPRYLLPVVPAITIAVGAVTAWLLSSKARVAGAIAAVGIPALFIVCSANIVWDPYYQFPDWYLVNLVVLQNEKPSDAMLFVQGFPYVVVGDFTAFRKHDAAGPSMPEDMPYTFRWLHKHAGVRVWYIENQYFYPDPHKRLKAYLDGHRKPVVLPSGRTAIWSEARASAGDVVNVILYDKETAKRNGAPKPAVPRVTSAKSRLERASVGH